MSKLIDELLKTTNNILNEENDSETPRIKIVEIDQEVMNKLYSCLNTIFDIVRKVDDAFGPEVRPELPENIVKHALLDIVSVFTRCNSIVIQFFDVNSEFEVQKQSFIKEVVENDAGVDASAEKKLCSAVDAILTTIYMKREKGEIILGEDLDWNRCVSQFGHIVSLLVMCSAALGLAEQVLLQKET